MNKKEMKRKKGWTLMELCVAMIALAILVGISIQSIKVKKFMYGPFAYAGMYNLKQASNAILNKCNAQGGSGIYGCQSNAWKLPVTDQAAVDEINNAINSYNASNGSHEDNVSLDNIDEIFCMEVANMFTLIASGGEIRCNYTQNSNSDYTKLPTPNENGHPNFQASNMVTYYFLERPWLRINKAAPTEDDLSNATDDGYFKPIFIDVNGDKAPNKLGQDQFPLRLYLDGTITPGSCAPYPDEKPDGEDYPANLYCPSRMVAVGGVEQPVEVTDSWLETNYPFAFNLYKSFIPENASSDDRDTKIVLRNVSYQVASCKSGRHIAMPRRSLCENDAGTDKETKPNADNLQVLRECTSEELNAFCITRFAKPSNPGLFRLPMM